MSEGSGWDVGGKIFGGAGRTSPSQKEHRDLVLNASTNRQPKETVKERNNDEVSFIRAADVQLSCVHAEFVKRSADSLLAML